MDIWSSLGHHITATKLINNCNYEPFYKTRYPQSSLHHLLPPPRLYDNLRPCEQCSRDPVAVLREARGTTPPCEKYAAPVPPIILYSTTYNNNNNNNNNQT